MSFFMERPTQVTQAMKDWVVPLTLEDGRQHLKLRARPGLFHTMELCGLSWKESASRPVSTWIKASNSPKKRINGSQYSQPQGPVHLTVPRCR
jgi:hypothetical protein